MDTFINFRPWITFYKPRNQLNLWRWKMLKIDLEKTTNCCKGSKTSMKSVDKWLCVDFSGAGDSSAIEVGGGISAAWRDSRKNKKSVKKWGMACGYALKDQWYGLYLQLFSQEALLLEVWKMDDAVFIMSLFDREKLIGKCGTRAWRRSVRGFKEMLNILWIVVLWCSANGNWNKQNN